VRHRRGKSSQIGRRIFPFAALLAGAIVGTTFVVANDIVLPHLLTSLVVGVVGLIAKLLRTSADRWANFSS
jgi:hypothetical protein